MPTGPVRVAHLITTLDTGGAETALARVVSRLDRQVVENTVISLTPGGALANHLADAGIPVHSLRMRRGVPSLGAAWRLRALLRRYRPQVLQTWLYHADLLGALVAPAAGRPLLAWNLRASDMRWDRYRRLSQWTQEACIRLSGRPDVVVVNSYAGLAHHRALGYRPRSWRVIPNGVDETVFRPDAEARHAVRRELGIDDAAPVIGMVARLDPMKDHRTFLAAARILLDDWPTARFVLVGAGVGPDADGLRQFWQPVVHAVTALGVRSDVSRILCALDVFTLASLSEGFPNALVEAMACGLPCAATDVGDVRHILDGLGPVVPVADPRALAAAWRNLLAAGEHHRTALGMAARAAVAARFSLARCVSAYEALYRDLVASSAAR